MREEREDSQRIPTEESYRLKSKRSRKASNRKGYQSRQLISGEYLKDSGLNEVNLNFSIENMQQEIAMHQLKRQSKVHQKQSKITLRDLPSFVEMV